MYHQHCNKMYDIELGLLVLFISTDVRGHALSLSPSSSLYPLAISDPVPGTLSSMGRYIEWIFTTRHQ